VLFVKQRIVLLTLRVIVGFICCLASICSLGQQLKPNLTGTWKINLKSSKLAPAHPPEQHERYKIRHAEPRLEVTHSFNGRSEVIAYVTDGKERVVHRSLDEGPIRAKAYWEGETLVIEKHQDQVNCSWVSRFSLSQDGKSLGIAQHVAASTLSGPFDESLVYDKER